MTVTYPVFRLLKHPRREGQGVWLRPQPGRQVRRCAGRELQLERRGLADGQDGRGRVAGRQQGCSIHWYVALDIVGLNRRADGRSIKTC